MVPEKQHWIGWNKLEQAAECLRALGHPVRLRMIDMMLKDQFSVGELAEAVGIKSHAASGHLRLMQRCGLLFSKRKGQRTFYRIAKPKLAVIMECIDEGFGAPPEDRQWNHS